MSEQPKEFYGLLEAIRERPAMYLGIESLDRLDMWLQGYKDAKWQYGITPDANEKEFYDREEGFDEFVQHKYDWHDVGGWAAKIRYYHRNDVAALYEFFGLLDEFRQTKAGKIKSLDSDK